MQCLWSSSDKFTRSNEIAEYPFSGMISIRKEGK